MRIVYSFNKSGYEAECWEREIRGASDGDNTFVPFNHGAYLDPVNYIDAVTLDRLYQSRHSALHELYMSFQACLKENKADAVIVTNAPPYHPDFLRNISGVYKVLYSGDDPGATYMRNIPYLHAYQHVMYMAPGYSPDMDLGEKMRYCGMINADWVPISVFDFEYDSAKTFNDILDHPRDIDVIYVGGFFRQKLELLARLKKVFGSHLCMHGFFQTKHNIYYNIKYGFPGWMRPVSYQQRVDLYQRAKIGFNIHWNEHGLGNQRLYHLPANGVMQISDCPDLIGRVFEPGVEIEGYASERELIEKLEYYLGNDEKRENLALNGYKKVMQRYRFETVTKGVGDLIKIGMQRINWST